METKEEIAELEKHLKEDIVWKPMKSPVKRLNYFMKDKKGEELSFKQFMSRWKEGMEGVTPLQQISMQVKSTWIMLLGIFCGIVVVSFAVKTLWWLLIILIGAFFNTSVMQLGQWQKKRIYQNMEEMMK